MTQKAVLVDPLKDPMLDRVIQAELDTAYHAMKQKLVVFGDPIKDDFRVFLTVLWRHLKLPDPTPLQLDIAWHLQHSQDSRNVIMAFRGAAKSWITAAYVLWLLLRNPQHKVMVASGSVRRSVAFVNFCLNLIGEVPCLKVLRPKPNQRQSSTAFDVGPSLPDQTPSLFAVGITAQIVGFRADTIVGDDVETNTNSMTPLMREKLADSIKEFDAILKPGGEVWFLGTPQTESSIYNVLPKRGYVIAIWPARYPKGKQRRVYGDKLARFISFALDNNPRLAGLPTEPTRFSDEDLAARELSWGMAGFALQFMLDTTLSDVDKYPLKIGDLMVMSLDMRNGPDLVSWGSGDHLVLKDVDPISFDGDRAYAPASVSETYSKWQGIQAFIDPSGRGKDETTLTIGAVLHSTAYCLKQGGWQDGYSETTLREIANLLVQYNVASCKVEEDFGQGMFAQLLRPYVKAAWEELNKRVKVKTRTMTEIVSERAQKMQKELRILEVLEPLFQNHRLVMSKEVLQDDYRVTMNRDGTDMRDRYSLMYQITRLSREKDCLTHDDRVEGLAGCMAVFQELLGLRPQDQADAAEEKRIEEFWEEYFKETDRIGGVRGPNPHRLRRGLRVGERKARRR